MSDCDENTVRFHKLLKTCLVVADRQSLNTGIAEGYFKRSPVERPGNLAVPARPVLHNLRSAQLRTAVDQGHAGSEPRQEARFLHCGVAAANHYNLFAAEEEPVAGCTGADPAPDIILLSRDAQVPRRSPGRNNYRLCFEHTQAIHGYLKWALREVHSLHPAILKLSPKALCLLAHVIHQIRTQDAVRKTREVLYLCRCSQLSSRLQAFNNKGAEIGTCQVNRGSQSCRACSDYNCFVHEYILLRVRYFP
ncbi:hypothetical protein D3C73_989310 [compost metagenome]